MKSVYKIILIALLVKIIYIIFAHFFGRVSISSLDAMLNVFMQNDSGWYKSIAENGYSKISKIEDLGGYFPDGTIVQSSWAFFPAYPYLIKTEMYIFGFSFAQSAFTWSIILSIVNFLLFYQLVLCKTKDEKIAYKTTVLYIVFPFHYYFSMYYTESLFMVCLLGAWISILYKKQFGLIIVTCILVLTRPNGLIALLPLGILALEQWNIKFKWRNTKLIAIVVLLFLPAILVFASYLFYQYKVTGYYNAFSIAQKGWGKQFIFPFLSLFRQGNIESLFNSIYVIIVMIFALLQIKKMYWSSNILVWVSLLLPLTAGSTVSMLRYISVIFPLFILFSIPIAKSKFFIPIAFLFFGLQLYMFSFWLQTSPLSF